MTLKQITFLITALVIFSQSSFAATPLPNELNRRNFVSLNVDSSELQMTILYPSSTITQVCGIQLRTNIAFFANSHMEAVIAGIEVVENDGIAPAKELVATQHISEPPYFTVTPQPAVQDINIRIKTRTGETLRELIKRVADPKDIHSASGPVEVVAVAKHCQDKSN